MTKFNKTIVQDIASELEKGISRDDACTLHDINRITFYDWMKKKPYFANVILKAELACKTKCIKRIMVAGLKGDWHADAWHLERKYRDEFAKRTEVTGKNGGALTAIPVEITKDESKL